MYLVVRGLLQLYASRSRCMLRNIEFAPMLDHSTTPVSDLSEGFLRSHPGGFVTLKW
jgi:hypothetical protein